MTDPLSHVLVDRAALTHNVGALRAAAGAGPDRKLCAMVKGNAYGHGLLPAAQTFVAAGVDWLGIGEVTEAEQLAAAGITAPTYCVCPITPDQADAVVSLGIRVNVVEPDLVAALARAATKAGVVARVHIKVETGTNRQGATLPDAVALARKIVAEPSLVLEGCSTHFADIEDTTDHRFAKTQLARFVTATDALAGVLQSAGRDGSQLLAHASNTAAVLLWPDAHGGLLRFGIGAYGIWPSKETFVSAQLLGRGRISLREALCWKTVIAQVKSVPARSWVGYGRTFSTVRDSRVAILPIGYYDGYDRGLSNTAQVLVGGQRAPVIGRVAMNMVAIDITDNPDAAVGSEVVLLGPQSGPRGSDQISADEMAGWLDTISYEVTTRIHPRLPRLLV